MPDLSQLGYTLVQQGRDPAATAGQDVYRALFQKTGGGQKAAMTVLYVFPDEATAHEQFAQFAVALKNPPPDFVGAQATYTDAPSPKVGDEQKTFATATKDSQGNRVWSDLYRFGRLVAIVQVLDSAESDQMSLRTSVAQRIRERAQ